MIDRGSNYGQSDGNIYARLKTKKFYRYVALVVIHRNDQVKVSSACKVKERVRWMRAGYVVAFFAKFFDRWSDFGFFFSSAEKATFSGVRINRCNAHTSF